MVIATTTTATDTITAKWIGVGILLGVAWFAAGLAWLRASRKRADRLAIAEASKLAADCDETIRANDRKIRLIRGIVRSRQALPAAGPCRDDEFRDGRKAA